METTRNRTSFETDFYKTLNYKSLSSTIKKKNLKFPSETKHPEPKEQSRKMFTLSFQERERETERTNSNLLFIIKVCFEMIINKVYAMFPSHS